MTNLSNILSGSDNLWKYIFTMGVLLVAMSIFYPLSKSEEINLKIIELKTDSQALKKQIEHLQKDVKGYKRYLEIADATIDSLRAINTGVSKPSTIEKIEIEIATERNKVKAKIRDLEMLTIKNQGKEDFVIELQSQSKSYNSYFKFGFIFGLVLLFFGLFKWVLATIASDKIRWKELDQSELEFLKDSMPKFKFPSLFKDKSK